MKTFDIDNWKAVHVHGGGMEIKVQTDSRKWLTVCDLYCLKQRNKVWLASVLADRIAALPQLEQDHKHLRTLAAKALRELERLGALDNDKTVGRNKIYHALKRELERKP